jgi:lipopolysaccharide export system protein LptC
MGWAALREGPLIAMAEAAAQSVQTSSWSPGRRMTLKQARGRSRLVQVMRFLFVGLAFASLASVFVYTTLYSMSGGFERTATAEVGGEAVTMLQPRFTGRLNEETSYQLTATEAQRPAEDAGPINLNAPIYRESQGRVIVAPSGAYAEEEGMIRLTGGVTFTDEAGNRFTSSDAVIDTRNGILRGNAEIMGEGPLGVLRADAYEIQDSTGTIIFRGRVRGTMPAGRGG